MPSMPVFNLRERISLTNSEILISCSVLYWEELAIFIDCSLKDKLLPNFKIKSFTSDQSL
ncbi:hypothetical protein [Rickettsia honei]|uniref:hypothetical protein n=1 Tax=Rickettsia honei TaxID=37816 RepID=UPI00037FAA83|nr:hypothetical protein [Rickettsia honei]